MYFFEGLTSPDIGAAAGMYGITAMTGLGAHHHLLGRGVAATTAVRGGASTRLHSLEGEAIRDQEDSPRGRAGRR